MARSDICAVSYSAGYVGQNDGANLFQSYDGKNDEINSGLMPVKIRFKVLRQ